MADLKISALTSATTPLVGTEQVPLVQSGTTKKTTTTALLSVGNGTTTFGPVLNGAGSGANAGIYYLLQNGGTTTIGMGNKSSLLGGAYSAIPIFYFNGQADFYDNATLRGRWDSSGNLAVANGNVVISTSGKGIDFSATAGTGTSELLADYEEGTWTPTILGGTTAGTPTYTSQVGSYTKIGRQVTLRINLAWSAISGSPTGLMLIGGLPFAYDAVFATFPISEQNLTHTPGTSLVVAMAGGGYSSTQFNLAQVAPATAFTTLNIVTSGQVFGTVTYFV